MCKKGHREELELAIREITTLHILVLKQKKDKLSIGKKQLSKMEKQKNPFRTSIHINRNNYTSYDSVRANTK